MGVLKQGILGGFSGKVANIVGSSWKGIAVIKSLPLSVANPQTAGQTSQRTKFSAAVAMAIALLATIVKPLWDRFAQNMSGYNAWISANIDYFSALGVATYASLKFSQGGLLNVDAIDSAVVDVSDGTVTVDWTSNAGTGNALATDVAYVVCINEVGVKISGGTEPATRDDASTVIPIPEGTVAGQTCHVYLMFKKADGTLVSNTLHTSVAAQA